MEKTLTIDGKSITFRKSGATMLAYKRQTGREFYSDLSAFIRSVRLDKGGNIVLDEHGLPCDMDQFNVEYMYNMIHVMARSADKNVPSDMLEWLDTFDEFDVMSIFSQLMPMLGLEMKIDEKNSLTAAENPPAAAI